MTGEILSVESFFRICLWQSIVLAAVGLAASFVLRQRSSRAHQVLLMSIVAAMIVPVISMLVKHYELGMFVAEPVAMQPQSNAQFPASSLSSPSRIAQDFGYEAGPIEEDVPSVTTGQQRSAILWAHIALCAWPAASLILVIRLIMTFLSGTHLLGRSQPLACAKMEHAVRSAKARLGIYKPVEVRSSRGVRSPVIWCWRRRPVLLVPCAAGRGENGVDWTGVLCHELAHWKRRDHISGLLAELAVCALPWHVLLWWARFRLTSLSEKACDDWVLATGQAGADYAESLLELTPGRQMAFVPAVVSSRKELAGRVRRILRDSCGNPRMGAAWAVAVSIVAACIAIGVAFAQTRPAGSEEDEDNNSLTERFELNKDIAIKLDIGPDGMHKTINARSVRFDKTDSGMRATLRADVRRGLPFEWKTMIELLGDGDEVLGWQESSNKARSLVSGQPVIEARQIEFAPFNWNEVTDTRRFRLSFEQNGTLRDEINRPYDATRTDWIRGRVTGPDGLPATEAIVIINEHKAEGGPFKVPRVGTDENGYYRFGAVDWPYRLGAERRQRIASTGVDCYQLILLKQIFNGPQTVDFKFSEPRKGAASFTALVADDQGAPISQFTANVMEWSDPQQTDFENDDGSRLESTWYNQEVNTEDGVFRLENIPPGRYRIRIAPTEKRYEWHHQEVVLADNRTTDLVLTVRSRHVLYGRVLFEDGSPAVLKPAPWPGAETRVLLPSGGRARRVATVEEDGYFAAYLDDNSFEQLESTRSTLVVSIPATGQGRHVTTGEFPFELLAAKKNEAGVLKVNRPAEPESTTEIAECVEKLDKSEKILREYETVKLDYVDADEVAKRLKEAIQQMPGTELQQGVLIQPLTLARQVIIFGRKDLREKVKKLIAEIDSPLDMERLRPRIVALSNSDPAQMAELLTALFAAEGGGRVNMIVFGKVTEEERKTVGQLSDRLTFESVPGTSKLIVISGIAEAYDPVERLILELDRQNMAAKDVKEVRQWIRNRGHEPTRTALPAGWTLDYDDGILAGGGRRWPANMAKDLASLEIRLKPYDPREASLKGEEYEFRAYSLEGTQVGSISVRPESERHVPRSKIFKPGKYLLEYRRRWGPSGDNFRIESGQYPIDLSKPGMYELTFTPKIGAAKITGTLGGCYAINFERIGSAPWVRGFAYVDPRLDKQYLLDGLPPGKYLLSAVTQRQSDNVFVDQAELTIAAGEKIAVDMARPAKGSCTLKGTLLGKQRKYATPWPDTWPQSQGKWYVLIRKPGSGAVERVDAYEALTMDSLYVVRGRNLTQQTKDRATYRIEGVAPGDYTVTAIEHPSWGGCVVTRQQSRRLVLRPGENVLDFDLRDVSQPRDNPGAEDIESAPAPESRRRTDEEIESTRPRIISFPKGQSMGKLFVRDPGADNWYEGWQELGEAIGDVSVDAGKEVKLEISEQSAGDLSPLAGLRTDDLEMLCFGWRPVRVGSLEPIGNLSGLKALNIQRAKFDSEDFRHLTGLTQLEVLRCGDYKLSDESMRYVGQLTSLRSLALWGTGISDEGLKHLQGLRNLTFLALNRCEITDHGLGYLKNMTALEGLQIYQTKITDYGLAELQGLSRLKHIKLGYNGITDKGLKHLENLTSLENIWLDSNPITDEGLPYLAGMKNLKQLYIPRTRVTDAGLVHLKGMKDFDHLLIDGISDEGIRHLSELPDLEFLQIQDSRVTKASIPDFKRMNSLNRVLLSGDRVNDDLLDALRAALPTCKIWDPQRSLDYPMPEWRKRFEAVYRLEDGQVLKRIAPPFIPERRDYYLNEETLQARHIRRSPDHFTFEWTGKLKKWGMGFGTGSHPLGRVLGNDLIVERDRFEGSEELMRIEVPGDWIVREGVSVGEKLKALEKILADELGRNIRFVKRTVERQAIVATGSFKFRPLPAAKDSKWVHVFVGDFDPDAGGSGGTAGSVADFLGAFGDDLDIAMINQTEPSGQIQVPYRNRLSRLPSTLGRMADPTKKANLLTEVLNNVSLQTNLQFEVTRRGVEVWHVSEVGNAR